MLKILSHILSPPAVAVVMATVFSLLSPNMALSSAFGILFLAVIPTLPFLCLLRRKMTDIDIRSRKIRAAVLAAAVASYAASSAVFYYLGYHAMLVLSLAYLFVGIAVMINNMLWKISIHAAGVAGPTTAMVFVFGTGFVPLYILTAAVFYARLKLRAHTLIQLFGGAAVGIAVTFLTYLFFY